jgi:antitoxin component of RelBE/YafQ-DinJ toxin-antitoxin module
MSPRRKPNQPAMKYWGFYASEELKAETIKCAEQLNISDSEYIRIAIEAYNLIVRLPLDSTHNTVSNLAEQFKEAEAKGEVLHLDARTADNTHKNNTVSKPDKMVQSFMKGGK